MFQTRAPFIHSNLSLPRSLPTSPLETRTRCSSPFVMMLQPWRRAAASNLTRGPFLAGGDLSRFWVISVRQANSQFTGYRYYVQSAQAGVCAGSDLGRPGRCKYHWQGGCIPATATLESARHPCQLSRSAPCRRAPRPPTETGNTPRNVRQPSTQ